MKKNFFRLLAVVFVAVLAFSLVSCTDDAKDSKIDVAMLLQNGHAAITVTTITNGQVEKVDTYGVGFDGEYLIDVLMSINEVMESTGLLFTMTEGSFGFFVSNLTYNDIDYVDSTKNEFVSMYCTVNDINYTLPTFTTVYNSVMLYSCGLGVSQMPVLDFQTYLFTIEAF